MINDIKSELEKRTGKYHLIACWVGIILNPIFLINDNQVLDPTEFNQIAISKILVSLLLLMCIIYKDKFNISYKALGILPVCLICFFSSYMYSEVNSIDAFQMHSFSYTTLFLGAGMLCLWEVKISMVIFVFNLFFIMLWQYLYGELSITEFFINGGAMTISASVFMIFLINIRYTLTLNNIRSEFGLKEAKEIIELKNEEITSSIKYAERIQKAILPPISVFKKHFENTFIFYLPKDIVSGDLYWFYETDNKVCFAVLDCTGHGVPGAFLTFIGNNILIDAMKNLSNNLKSSEVLLFLHKEIQNRLNPYSENEQLKDAMDISLCIVDKNERSLCFSGAHNSLIIIRDNKLKHIKSSSIHIGDPLTNIEDFKCETIRLDKGDQIYLYTDGFQDQFGGPKGRKFMSKRFRDLIHGLSEKPMKEQGEKIKKTFINWKDEEEQVDDVTVLGIKV